MKVESLYSHMIFLEEQISNWKQKILKRIQASTLYAHSCQQVTQTTFNWQGELQGKVRMVQFSS